MEALRVAVLDDFAGVAHTCADWGALGPDCTVEFFRDHLADEPAVAERLRDFDVVAVMRERTPFPRSLIERLPRLRLLVTTGPRNNAIDMAACAERGITVCGTRRGEATVELTWGLIFALARGIVREDQALRQGRWQVELGTHVREKTLGILGLGRLGTAVAQIGRAFGMQIIAWSQNLGAETAAAAGAKLVDKRTLFAQADILSVHVILSERTRGIVDAEHLQLMKPTALFINTSRAGLVDTGALIAALEDGRIGGAALDVYDREPLPPDDPILRAPNTVLTPHLGYATRDAWHTFFPDTVEDITAWRNGTPIRVLAAPSRDAVL